MDPNEQSSTSPVENPEKPKTLRNKARYIIGGLVILILFTVFLSIGIYAKYNFYNRGYEFKPLPTSQTSTPIKEQKEAWKTYTSVKNGFEIQYNSNKYTRRFCQDADYGFTLEYKNEKDIDPQNNFGCAGTGYIPPVTIRVTENIITLNNLGTASNSRKIIEESIDIDGNTMTKYTITVQPGSENGPGDTSSIRLVGTVNSKNYSIYAREEDTANLLEMLSTFKFLDTSDETLTWNTIESEENNFSVKYPSGWVRGCVGGGDWCGPSGQFTIYKPFDEKDFEYIYFFKATDTFLEFFDKEKHPLEVINSYKVYGPTDEPSFERSYLFHYITSDDKNYIIASYSPVKYLEDYSDDKNYKEFKKMLSTFNFTN